MSNDSTLQVESCINRLRAGDASARDELIGLAYDRLVRLTRKIGRSFPSVKRWEETQDVANAACMRLHQALLAVELKDARHFFRLAAQKIRFELLDLARHYGGPEGMGQNHATHAGFSPDASSAPRAPYEGADETHEPANLAEMTEMHRLVEELSDEDREIFDLIYYHELPQHEAADLLGLSTRQVRRRWRHAQIELGKRLRAATGDGHFLQ